VAHLLGRHVKRRPHDGTCLRQHTLHRNAFRTDGLGDSEVEHFDEWLAVASAREEQIRRLEVAVHDARGMSLGDGVACLQQVIDGHWNRKRTLGLDQRCEVGTAQKFHHDERFARIQHADVMDANHVIAAQSRRCPSLALQTHRSFGAVCLVGRDELDGDALSEFEVQGGNHDAHATGTDYAFDPVLAG
jgi:hypothetical protein